MGYKKILHPGIEGLNVSKLPLNSSLGLLAQMVERFAGSEEVAGSNPVQSTKIELSGSILMSLLHQAWTHFQSKH